MIELLSAVAIIAILLALLFSASSRYLEGARRTKCLGNLRQIGIASKMYAGEHNNTYPALNGGCWPFGDLNGVPGVGPGGPGGLFAGGYISDPRVFYCPSNDTFSQEKNWNPEMWFQSYTSYCYFGGFQPNGFTEVGDYGDSETSHFADRPSSPGSTLLAMDICAYSSSYDPISHMGGANPGGNILFNDGHVVWRNLKDMKYRYERSGWKFWW